MKKLFKAFAATLASIFLLSACSGLASNDSTNKNSDFLTNGGSGEALRIVAGSEQKILEPIVEAYAAKSGNKIAIDYLGSLDIMNQLQTGEIAYDAVWPASSIWLEMGDSKNILKHEEVTSITPVIFGIKQSLAEELGFVGKDGITMTDISQAIDSDRLNFTMTSATQSNSGASAYLAFLTALSKTPEDGLSMEDLADPELQNKITSLLSGVERSSGSSNWLVDLFLMGNYNAMVNYEQLIIQTNIELERQGKETLYAVYPSDGISLSNAPLAYVDKKNDKKEEIFLDFQKYILSDEAQNKIERTGKRNAFGMVSDNNKDVYDKDKGFNVDDVLSPIRLPQSDVIQESLIMYQTNFKKPAYTIYVLDYSGSMHGQGNQDMLKALEQVLLPENSRKHYLLGTQNDKTIVLPFASNVKTPREESGNDLTVLYDFAKNQTVRGGTAMYEAIIEALNLAQQEATLENYTPAIVVLSDGKANGDMGYYDLENAYKELELDIPIFSIKFGKSDDSELSKIAELSRARVFDGRENLIGAFKKVKGYN